MEIKVLTYFLQLCEDKNFTEAAEKLYITQQGLSLTIKRLEKELGASLFFRTSKGLILTEHGKELQASSEIIVRQYWKLLDRLKVLSGNNSTVKIASIIEFFGTSSSSMQSILLNNNEKFSVAITESTSRENEIMLQDGSHQLGLVCEPFDKSRFNYQYLFTMHLVYIISDKHPLAGKQRISILELSDQPLVVFSKKFNQITVLSEEFKKSNLKFKIACEVAQPHFIPDIIHKNPHLIGCSTDFYVKNFSHPSLRVIASSEHEISSKVYIASRKDQPLSPNATLLMQYIVDDFTKNNKLR